MLRTRTLRKTKTEDARSNAVRIKEAPLLCADVNQMSACEPNSLVSAKIPPIQMSAALPVINAKRPTGMEKKPAARYVGSRVPGMKRLASKASELLRVKVRSHRVIDAGSTKRATQALSKALLPAYRAKE